MIKVGMGAIHLMCYNKAILNTCPKYENHMHDETRKKEREGTTPKKWDILKKQRHVSVIL
jgi:hypothetical protein